LTNLRRLDLDHISIGDAGLAHLAGLRHLRSLKALGQVTDDGLKHLAGLTELRELEVSGWCNNIRGEGLVHVKGLSELRSLSIRSGEFAGVFLMDLKGLTKLEHLSVNGIHVTGRRWRIQSEVGDSAVPYLKELRPLRKLDLSYTKLSREGLQELQKALPNCEVYFEPIY
jgi:hypothetical protein